jgi:hypothetical protein
MDAFTRFILHEANPPKQQPNQTPAVQNKIDQNQQDVPDFTQQQDPNAQQGAAPQASSQQQDTGMQPDPTQQGAPQGDPTQMGAQGPDQQGMDMGAADSNDPNAQMQGQQEEQPQDPNNDGSDLQAPEGDEMSAESPEAQTVDLDQLEQDTFKDLKPEQMEIKKKELRKQFRSLNSIIIDSIDKINKISHTSYDDELLNFIVRKLLALKNLSRDTLTDTFNTRTYLENEIELQRMITVFNYLTNLMDKVYESRIKRQNKITEIINKEVKHNKSFLDLPTFSRNYEIQ